MHTKADIEKLAEDFKNCQKVLTSLFTCCKKQRN